MRIGSDEVVTVIVNHSEMGQGVYTSLPMLVAEELGCDWNKIRVEAAPVDQAYNHADWAIIQGTVAARASQASGNGCAGWARAPGKCCCCCSPLLERRESKLPR